MSFKKRIAIFSPNPKSFYSTTVCELLMRSDDVIIDSIYIKKFTLSRFRSEFARDGIRLLKKIWDKLILGKKVYSDNLNIETIINLRAKREIKLKNLCQLKSSVDVFTVNDLNEKFVERELKNRKIDVVVFTGGGLIKQNILDVSGLGVINCHMGKLPNYRGMDVVEWPILKNDFDNIGFTVHLMDKGVDTGDILFFKNVKPIKNDNIKSLRMRFETLMTETIVNVTLDFLKGKITRLPQKLKDGSQYYIMHKSLYNIAENNLKNWNDLVQD